MLPRFDGTVHIGLDPEYIARFYADAAPGLPHAGALVRADGEVLIREPVRTTRSRLGADSPLMREIAVRPEGGFAIAASGVDGAQRLFAYRKVAGYAEVAELAASGLSLRPKPFGQAALATTVEGCVASPSSTGGHVVPFRAR